MNIEKLVRMVNQIEAFFAHEGAAKAPISIADHLSKFWEPRMRAALMAAVAARRAPGLGPLAHIALKQLAAAASTVVEPRNDRPAEGNPRLG